MAYIQRTTPPPNKILNFSLKEFNGGLNNRSDQLLVNEASDLINMTFADDTVMERRKGQMFYDALALTGELTYIDQYKPYDDTDKLIRATNTAVYLDSTKLCDVTGKISGTNFLGRYYFVDGAKFMVYGKFPQTTSTYEKVIGTAVNSYILMEVTNPPSSYTPLDTSHTKGVLNIDYTNKKIWYEPCANEKADTYLGSNVLPEKPKYICNHNGRLFMSGADKDNDNVFISHKSNPHYYTAKLNMQLPPNSDKVVGLVVYDNSVVVGRQHDVYAISGDTNNPTFGIPVFQLFKVNTHTGFASNTSFSVAHNYLFYVGADGNAYSLSSVKNSDRVLSTTVISKSIDFYKPPLSFTDADILTVSSYFFKDEWYVAIKDKVLIYSYRHRAWTLWNNFNARSFYNLDNVLIWGRSDGRTAKHSTDYADFGKPYKSFWASKYFDMDESATYKQFREFFIVGHTYNEWDSDIYVTFQIDYVDVNDEVIIQNQIAVWGKSRWGDRFINRNIVNSLPFTIGRRGRAIKFIFSNGYEVTGTVATRAELDTYLGKKDNILVYVSGESKYYLYKSFNWHEMTDKQLFQAMKVYQVNGDYELRGKR